MTKMMIIAVLMSAVPGLTLAADTVELNSLNVGDVVGLTRSIEVPTPVAIENIDAVKAAMPLQWVAIPGGKFMLSLEQVFSEHVAPAREVTIKSFAMAKAAVTVAQYAECVSKGACKKPGTGGYCNWGKAGRENHPVNCVDWNQAQAYAKFKGARLPSEAEFAYAAASGGKNQHYPWGNQEPTSEMAVFNTNGTMPVCSKPRGNTAQGLCDMTGNVRQWMEDLFPNSGARVLRGGSFYSEHSGYLRVGVREVSDPDQRYDFVGFRLAR